MGFLSQTKTLFTLQRTAASGRSSPQTKGDTVDDIPLETLDSEKTIQPQERPYDHDVGVTLMKAAQAIWGKTGLCLIIVGLALVMIVFEVDNATVYIYNNYSMSELNAVSKLATLGTVNTIVFAVFKPPLAKISNILGRGQTYIFTMSLYVLGYILMSTTKNFGQYAAGSIFYVMGQSGTNLINDVTIGDITTARWRGFALSFSFFPFLITPWVSALIVKSVVAHNGIGWRWGIGIYAILLPSSASFIIVTLLYYQRRAKKMKLVVKQEIITVRDFCSQVDLGGIALLVAGLAMLLVPLTLAATSPNAWRTPYVDALICLGGLCLIALPFYEHYVAVNPVVPTHYFKNRCIVLCLILVASDSVSFSCTHTYLYSWGTIAHNLNPEVDTFYVYTNAVTQCFFAIVVGLLMAKTRRFKFIAISGTILRTIGYGVMLRLRGADNSRAELFIVQAIQGMGSGIIQFSMLVPAQISVPQAQLAQITALVVTMSFLGASIGSCIAGGIYSNTFRPALRQRLGPGANETLVDTLFDSITKGVPVWGSPERVVVDLAYTDVLHYMTCTALGVSIPTIFASFLLPNTRLPDRNNLVEM